MSGDAMRRLLDATARQEASADAQNGKAAGGACVNNLKKKSSLDATDVRSVAVTANVQAYEQLKQAVLAGNFVSGDIVTLRSLTALLGGGEMAAREALKRLIAQGAFEALPNRSARVPVLSGKELMQLADLRAMLEPEAAAQAAANISLHQIDDLSARLEAMKSALEQGDPLRYRALEQNFHFEIYRIADNRPLFDLIEALWLRVAPFMVRMVLWAAGRPGELERIANGHHLELIDAFRKRDVEAARVAMTEDLMELRRLGGFL